jgi:phosphoribosyl-AMP cyclohydrolase / phosphoribosyl-ATP pyrophosphohydrolase
MTPDFNKYPDGLMPAIIQDYQTRVVLMLGYMNEAAYNQTMAERRVTFYSRSKNRLWTKGETSGNFLSARDIKLDCDNDCLLIQADPAGPVCHTGADTCFNEQNKATSFLPRLETVIEGRKNSNKADSYVSKLFSKGINKIAQKVGEEAVELVIEAKDNDMELFKNEAADLLFHYLILLQVKGLKIADIERVLEGRHKS